MLASLQRDRLILQEMEESSLSDEDAVPDVGTAKGKRFWVFKTFLKIIKKNTTQQNKETNINKQTKKKTITQNKTEAGPPFLAPAPRLSSLEPLCQSRKISRKQPCEPRGSGPV